VTQQQPKQQQQQRQQQPRQRQESPQPQPHPLAQLPLLSPLAPPQQPGRASSSALPAAELQLPRAEVRASLPSAQPPSHVLRAAARGAASAGEQETDDEEEVIAVKLHLSDFVVQWFRTPRAGSPA
jgi:hypothetical protein